MAHWLPPDPISPRDELVIPRRRPQSVTLAGVLLYGSGVLGVLSAAALLFAAESVTDGFRSQALRSGVTAADATDVANALRTVLLSSGVGALAIGLLSVVLGRGVLGRSDAARIGAFVVTTLALGCSVVRTSITAFGANIDWTVAAQHATPALGAQLAGAFHEAMPGWLVGIGGGLTDLLTLGYIAVAVLLLMPASVEYFRTRTIAPPAFDPPV